MQDQADKTSSSTPGRFLRLLDNMALSVGSAGVVAFSLIVLYVIGSRYLLGQTPYWAEELPRLLLVWVTFIGTISAFARGTHFQAGLLPLIVREGRGRQWGETLASLCAALFLVVLAKTGWDITQHTWGNLTTALRWPVGLTYLALPICCSLSALAVVTRLFTKD